MQSFLQIDSCQLFFVVFLICVALSLVSKRFMVVSMKRNILIMFIC